MPWHRTEPVHERMRFILAHSEGVFSMTELCQCHGISRKTGYKWLGRFKAGGPEALGDHSRAPKRTPHAVSEPVAELLLRARRGHPDWGPRKLITYLKRRHPEMLFPAASTVGDLLNRHGLIHRPRPQRRRPDYPGAPAFEAKAPNDVWTADFKGEFLLGNRRYCYPLTVCDGFSRFILSCEALPSTQQRLAQKVFKRLFEEFGLPKVIRTDNGIPFATRAIHGLSRLSVYWMKLGIRHDRIDPGAPQQNGRHERMHRTLKAATTRPPEATFTAQQGRFDAFRCEFNTERPHQALAYDTPADHYRASTQTMPYRLPRPEYPGHYEVRRISRHGCFKYKSTDHFVSVALAGEHIGLEEVDDGIWSLYFYRTLLARFDERNRTITV
jgi:putative transposase